MCQFHQVVQQVPEDVGLDFLLTSAIVDGQVFMQHSRWRPCNLNIELQQQKAGIRNSSSKRLIQYEHPIKDQSLARGRKSAPTSKVKSGFTVRHQRVSPVSVEAH